MGSRPTTRTESREATARSLAVAVAIAVATGLAMALAKRYLDWSLGIPGHGGVGWIAALITGTSLNPRRGMATVAGAAMAFWAVPVGLNHTLAYNLALYTSAAALLDGVRWLRLPTRFAAGAALAGAAVHVFKFGFVFGNALLASTLRNVQAYGFLAALRNHVIFGLMGGLLGWALLKGKQALWARWSGAHPAQ